MKSKKLRALGCAFILGLVLLATRLVADDRADESNWDLGLRTGLLFGTVTQNNLAVAREFNYGGFPLGLVYTHNLSPKWTIQAGGTMVLDVSNLEISSTTLDLTGLYHVVGGARSLLRDYGGEKVVSREARNLSVLAGMAFENYHASSKAGGPSLTGSVLDLHIGAEYRFDIDESNSLAFQLSTTLFSLSASLEQLSVHLTQLTGTWRFFL